MRYRQFLVRLSLIATVLASATGPLVTRAYADAPAASAKPVVVLDSDSFWRVRTVWETEDIQKEDGSLTHQRVAYKDRQWWSKNRDAKACTEYEYIDRPVVRLPESTSPDWMQPNFDDGGWARIQAPVFDKLKGPAAANWKAIYARGRFHVEDPSKVTALQFNGTFRGGATVYLNGKEVDRAFMPKGKLTPNTPALPYPENAYLDDQGYVLSASWRDKKALDAIWGRRNRQIQQLDIPGSLLKQGVNVLAVAVHRSPGWYRFYMGRWERSASIHADCYWGRCALVDLNLTADSSSAGGLGGSSAKDHGFVVWNQSIVSTVFVEDAADPFSPLSPIELAGVRNGSFAAQLVVGDDKPITNLKVTPSDLQGTGSIPADNITVRFGLNDGAPRKSGRPAPFDALEEFAPAEIPVSKEHGGAVQQVWINVAIPKGTKPGDYEGKIVVSAEGVSPIEVPLKLKVIDWTLPDPSAYTPCLDIIESPESLAMAYGVELWSDEHFVLLDKVFALLKPLANKTLYISAVRRTHFGNEHAMVRWIRDEQGELQPNFEIAEKYLDVATKHLGKIPGVVFYCWEPVASMGHASGTGTSRRTTDKPAMITLWDVKKNKLKKRKGPAWGTPEAKLFWAKFNKGAAEVLKKRGMEKSMLYGLIGDARPTKQAMDDITSGVKDAKWAVHSHHYCVNWKGYEIGMGIALWGVGCKPVDPIKGYGYGWKNPFWLSYYPREMSMKTSLVETRTKLEKWMGAKAVSESVYSKAIGTRGLGRLGADFWSVPSGGKKKIKLAGRYPESYWGQLNLNYCVPHLFGIGKNGPLPTVRSEAFRENLQEMEARISIERALTDEAKKTALGADLAGRCQALLDKRIRMCVNADGEGRSWFISSGWSERTEALFELAAEVQKKLKR